MTLANPGGNAAIAGATMLDVTIGNDDVTAPPVPPPSGGGGGGTLGFGMLLILSAMSFLSGVLRMKRRES